MINNFNSRSRFPFILNELGLNGTVVEVGVQRGINASHIRQNWNGNLFIGIDPWRPYFGVTDTVEMHERYRQDAINNLTATGKPFELMRMTSLEGAAELKAKYGEGFLDAVYLDGDHDYQPLMDDIAAWWPLVKSGGVVAGHDYVSDGWHRNEDPINAYDSPEEAGVQRGHCGPFYVIKAVQDCFGPGGKYGELKVYLTDESTDRGWRSWLVIKP